jgi:hypothetical protein
VASGVTFTPTGNVAATNVQAAIAEVDSEKVAKAGDTMTGSLTINTTGLSQLDLWRVVGQRANIRVFDRASGTLRWTDIVGDETAEGGSNAGSNRQLYAHDDTGAALGTVYSINRAARTFTFTNQPVIPGFATLASPTFTGDPKAPTPLASDNDTSIATTAFVTSAISTAGAGYVHDTGDTMTGNLKISVANGALGLLVAGPTKAARFVSSAGGFSIEGVDQTGVGSYQPLSLMGSAININAPVTVLANTTFTLGQDPALAMQAATKQYVDNVTLDAGTF